MKPILVIITLGLGLAGCGVVSARDDAFQARDEYVACIKESAAQPANCNSLWQAYQIKRQHYLDVMESN
jgi:hypothetical protein